MLAKLRAAIPLEDHPAIEGREAEGRGDEAKLEKCVEVRQLAGYNAYLVRQRADRLCVDGIAASVVAGLLCIAIYFLASLRPRRRRVERARYVAALGAVTSGSGRGAAPSRPRSAATAVTVRSRREVVARRSLGHAHRRAPGRSARRERPRSRCDRRAREVRRAARGAIRRSGSSRTRSTRSRPDWRTLFRVLLRREHRLRARRGRRARPLRRRRALAAGRGIARARARRAPREAPRPRSGGSSSSRSARRSIARCPYCHDDVAAGDAPGRAPERSCERCGAPHHADCFAEQRRVRRSSGARRERESRESVPRQA